jgi:hypothetical protein
LKRVPFDQRLWRPEPCLASQDRIELEAMRAEANGRKRPQPTLASVVMDHPELSHSYMAEVRRKILGLPKPETVDIRPRLDRAMGDKR